MMRPFLSTVCLALVFLFLAAGFGGVPKTLEPVKAQVLVQTRSWEADIASVEPLPQGAGYLLQVADRVLIMDGPQESWRLRETFPLPVFPAGGVAIADVTGAGQPNLIIGSEGAGATYVYRRGQHGWTLLGRTDYIWSPVMRLQTGEVSSPGRHDILVTGQDGRVHLFAWAFGEFQRRWESPDGNRWAAALGDLTGDGRTEVVLWREEGYVGVWRWERGRLEPLWENYPWGSIVGFALGDVDGDGLSDMVLNTSQRLLYAFGWQEGEFRLKSHHAHPELPLSLLAVRGRGRGADILGSDGSRLVWFRMTADGLQRQWASGPVGTVRGLLPVSGGEGFLLWREEGLGLLEPAPRGALRLVWRGEEKPLRYPPLVEEGTLWISARDVADGLGWSVHWDPEGRRLYLGGWRGFLSLQVDSAEGWGPSGIFSMAAPTRLEDGRVYVPYDALEAVGLRVTWDELRRLLVVEEPSW